MKVTFGGFNLSKFKLSKLKRKNPKTKIECLGKIAKKASDKGVFVKIDDPNYEIDDLLGCY